VYSLESPAKAICDGRYEGGICFALVLGWWVDVGLAVFRFLTKKLLRLERVML